MPAKVTILYFSPAAAAPEPNDMRSAVYTCKYYDVCLSSERHVSDNDDIDIKRYYDVDVCMLSFHSRISFDSNAFYLLGLMLKGIVSMSLLHQMTDIALITQTVCICSG